MNRTRKIVAGGIGVAVILAIVALMLYTPNLHTQTPVSTSPPSNGGTNNGGNGGNNTKGGPGAGNNTTPSCNETGDDHEWDDRNETNSNETAAHTWDDGNETSEVAVHSLDECNATGGDHDWKGDNESNDHNGHGEDGIANLLEQDVLSVVPGVWYGTASVASAVGATFGLVSGLLTGSASAGHLTHASR
jgi:hypothetical protein